MRKQEIEEDGKKREERLQSAKRENEEMETRILMGDKKAKLGIAFMYDLPPGMEEQMEREASSKSRAGVHDTLLGAGPHGTNKKNAEVAQYKFEWQKTAPRAKFLNDVKYVDMLNTMPTDKPFGIEVRNVMCVKCKVWGHCATDRDCPFYGKALKDIPERAADLAEKRKYLAKKYGESVGDDLDDFAKMENQDKIQRDSTKRGKLDKLHSTGQVTEEVRLRKKFRADQTGRYEMIGDDNEDIKAEADFVESEPESSSDEESSSEEEGIVWTAADREKILRKLQEAEFGIKKEENVKREKKSKKMKKEVKKEKKDKKKKKKKDKKVKKETDGWETQEATRIDSFDRANQIKQTVRESKQSTGGYKKPSTYSSNFRERDSGAQSGAQSRDRITGRITGDTSSGRHHATQSNRISGKDRFSGSNDRRPELGSDKRRENPYYNQDEEDKIKRRRRL